MAPEPNVFEEKVRAPGKAFLGKQIPGNNIDFSSANYWTRVLIELHDAYKGICAYTCHFIPLDTGSDTVEHFRPKANYPALAYEWANYRFVCGRMNGRKREFEDVLDPFTLVDGTFEIEFPSLQIVPSDALDIADRKAAEDTIVRLKLNDERSLRSRLAFVEPYCRGQITFDYLAAKAPFLAAELLRQSLKEGIREVMGIGV